jgi:hypothetical protein
MIRQHDDGSCRVAAFIGWETSGFCPEYWEAIKATNLLTPRDNCDWYKFITKSVSPSQYDIHWLVDRLWDRSSIKA